MNDLPLNAPVLVRIGATVCHGILRHQGTTYTFEAKVYDNVSRYGIKGGRISKLCVKEKVSQKPILNYDRGWDIRPNTATAKELVAAILAFYGTERA